MAVPEFQEFMLPILNVISDGEVHSKQELIELVSGFMHLSEEDKSEILPSGTQTRYSHRIGWATFDMYKAGLLERPQRGKYRITKRGLDLLKEKPNRIDVDLLLHKYVDFKNWHQSFNNEPPTEKLQTDNNQSSDVILKHQKKKLKKHILC